MAVNTLHISHTFFFFFLKESIQFAQNVTLSHKVIYVCIIYVSAYVCMYIRMHVCLYVHMHARMFVCTYVRTYVCIYVCMYVFIWVKNGYSAQIFFPLKCT